jgi:hypothetical protein
MDARLAQGCELSRVHLYQADFHSGELFAEGPQAIRQRSGREYRDVVDVDLSLHYLASSTIEMTATVARQGGLRGTQIRNLDSDYVNWDEK